MKRSLSVLLLSLAVCHLSSAPAAAQDQPQPPANLSLQIFFKQSPIPQYLSVEPGGTLWHTHFQRIPSWREPEGKLPIKAVVIARSRDGEQAVVRVSVSRGEKFYETSELVAEYRARPGESVTAAELSKFGIEPFRFKVVRRDKVALPEVGVTNLTRSIEVVKAEATDEKEIAVRLVLRNLSTKKVMGLELHVLGEGDDGGIAWPVAREGKALIEPGGEYKHVLPYDKAGREGADAYVPAPPDAVRVTSVLFADGSYEGEVAGAALNAANLAGYRAQLARVVALFERALDSTDAPAPEAAAQFRTQVSELGREADPAVLAELVASYPGLSEEERGRLKGGVEVAMHWVRQEVLKRLSAAEQRASSAQDDKPFRAWLAAQRNHYEQWLRSLAK